MDTEPTAIYNPFILSDRLHFPSFTDAFGDLLKIEAENLRKESQKKDRNSKQPTNNENPSHSQSQSTRNVNLATPVPKKTKSNLSVSHAVKSYGAVTPIPSRLKKHKKPVTATNPSTNTHARGHTKKASTYDVGVTPIPSKSKHKKNKIFGLSKAPPPEDSNLSIIVTPAPVKTKKRVRSTKTSDDESLVLMMADLMSPNPNNRCELSSPAPHDKNARLLTQTPVNFPILLPETPSASGVDTKEKTRSDLEEKWCNEYFSKHVPVLTPVKKRANPVKLYDPSKDINVTMMLEETRAPFADESSQSTETNPVDLLGDISMIAPPTAALAHIKPIKAQRNTSAKAEAQPNSAPFLSFGASFAFDSGNTNNHNNQNNMSKLSKFSILQSPNEDNASVIFNSNPPSEIKTAPVNVHHNEENDDDLLSSVEPMNDNEFFETSTDEIGTGATTTTSTQTEPVLVVAEEDLPKIRFNGRQITSVSAIYFDELNSDSDQNNTSQHSAQSDRMIYAHHNMRTPILRHNKESIDSLHYDTSNSSMSDSDSEAMVQSGHLMSVSYNGNKKKKQPNGRKMLKAYKQSKLAQNPNWTVCNGHRKTGELI